MRLAAAAAAAAAAASRRLPGPAGPIAFKLRRHPGIDQEEEEESVGEVV